MRKESGLVKTDSADCANSEAEKIRIYNRKNKTGFTYKLFAAKIDTADEKFKSN